MTVDNVCEQMHFFLRYHFELTHTSLNNVHTSAQCFSPSDDACLHYNYLIYVCRMMWHCSDTFVISTVESHLLLIRLQLICVLSLPWFFSRSNGKYHQQVCHTMEIEQIATCLAGWLIRRTSKPVFCIKTK